MFAGRVEPISAVPLVIPHEQFRLGYRPSLDGLRAFAVLAVMAHHAYIPFTAGGFVGVDIFFVLSGFLITSLLVEEWRKTGDISLRHFYVRRVLRLIPALVLFLLFIQCYSAAFFRGPRFWEAEKAIASVIFYVGNWVQAFHLVDMGALSHAWSLSIEEQFYLIWPLVLLLFLRSARNPRWIPRLLVGAIVLIAIRRAFLWTGPAAVARIYFGGDTRSDELLAGCALGAWVHMPTFPWLQTGRIVRYAMLPAVLLIIAVIVHPLPDRVMYTLGWPVVELAVATLILGLLLGIGGAAAQIT